MDGLREKYMAAIAAAQDESALEETRLAAVGKKGEVIILVSCGNRDDVRNRV